MLYRQRKIFCIGFNKTGTTSLHTFFEAAGLRSIHNDSWPYHSKIRFGRFLFHSRCYSDGEQCDFHQLNIWFPNSLFILNTRNERDWLYSRVKHVLRHNENHRLQDILSSDRYGKMAKEFFKNEEQAIYKWILERRLYHGQVRAYFKDDKRYMEIDITQKNRWQEDIRRFCETNYFRLPKRVENSVDVYRNKRDSRDINDHSRLQQYFALVDQVLENLSREAATLTVQSVTSDD